jgi:uncharacterized protein YybS (DUF2232 family)
MKLSDILGCAGGAFFLLLVSQIIPVFGIIAGVFIPLPFLYYSIKLGRVQGLVVAAISFAAIIAAAELSGFAGAMIMCAELGLLGLILGELYRQKFGIGATIFWGTVSIVILGIFSLFVIGLSRNRGPMTLIVDYFSHNIDNTFKTYELSGMDAESIAQLRDYGEWLKGIIEKIYPSLIILGSALVTWGNVLVGRRLLLARGLEISDFGSPDRWRAPDWTVWVFIGAGFAFFLPWGSVNFFALNSLVIIGAVYCFQGISILQFHMNKYRLPKYLRIGAYILILLQQYLLIGLVLVGLFDHWFDFRRIFKSAKELPED